MERKINYKKFIFCNYAVVKTGISSCTLVKINIIFLFKPNNVTSRHLCSMTNLFGIWFNCRPYQDEAVRCPVEHGYRISDQLHRLFFLSHFKANIQWHSAVWIAFSVFSTIFIFVLFLTMTIVSANRRYRKIL